MCKCASLAVKVTPNTFRHASCALEHPAITWMNQAATHIQQHPEQMVESQEEFPPNLMFPCQ